MKSRGLIFSIFIMFSVSAESSEYIKILKKKGRRAVVELPDENFVDGQNIRLDRGVYTETSNLNGRRDKRMDLDASILYGQKEQTVGATDSSTDTTTTTFALEYTFGINKGSYELGPLIGYRNSTVETDGAERKESELKLGGFLELNFKDNIPGEKMIPYIGTSLFYQTESVETSSKVKTNSFGATLEGGVKYFPYNDHFFVNFGPRIEYISGSTDDDNELETTDLNFILFAGLGVYY